MSFSAVHMIVYGRVQGVGFRFFVRENAVKLGIQGWVKNRPDSTVEIHAQAEKELLLDFIQIVKNGPLLGRVSEVNIEWVIPDTSFTHFTITF